MTARNRGLRYVLVPERYVDARLPELSRPCYPVAFLSPQPLGFALRHAGFGYHEADTRAIESDLSANLRMKVSIEHLDADGSGKMIIRYRSLDQLDALCQRLSAGPLDELE